MIRAAGIMFLTEDDRVLLLRRSGDSTHPGEWCFPGGGIEEGESASQAADREALEEIGWRHPEGLPMVEWTRVARDGVDFTTFLCRIPEPFHVTLNEEHTEFAWVPRAELSGARADSLAASDIDYRPDPERDPRPLVTIYSDGEIRVRAPK